MFKHSKLSKTASPEMHEANDCAVRAIANATRFSYSDVHKLLAKAGRKPAQTTDIRVAALAAHLAGGRLVVTENLKDECLQTGTYVVFMQTHCFCLKDGVTIDTIEPNLKERVNGVFMFKSVKE